MTKEEFKQQIIIAAIHGLVSNPSQVREAGLLSEPGVPATKIIAALAVSVANHVIELTESDRDATT